MVDQTRVAGGEGASPSQAATDPTEATRLQQYEIVWITPGQYAIAGCPAAFDTPDGFGLEIVDFLGPGDADVRGQPTVWVRGPVIQAATTSGGVRLVRGELVTVAVPHDQPRARRTGGQILPPPTVLASSSLVLPQPETSTPLRSSSSP